MELTPKGMPTSLRPFFQEYVLEEIDPDDHPFTVIERTLEWGNREEVRWLFAHYGRARLAEWVQQVGWRCLSRRMLHLWRPYFDLPELPERRNAWPH